MCTADNIHRARLILTGSIHAFGLSIGSQAGKSPSSLVSEMASFANFGLYSLGYIWLPPTPAASSIPVLLDFSRSQKAQAILAH